MRQAAITALGALIWGALSPTLLAQSEAMGADCGCLWEGSFSEVAPAADLIVIGEVRSIKGNAVDLVPEQSFKGRILAGYPARLDADPRLLPTSRHTFSCGQSLDHGAIGNSGGARGWF